MIVNHKKGSRSIVKVKIGGNEYYSYLMEDKYIKKGSKKRVYGRTEEELKLKVREIKEQFDLLNPTKPIKSNSTFSDCIRGYIEENIISTTQKTILDNFIILCDLSNELGNKKLKEISESDISDFLMSLVYTKTPDKVEDIYNLFLLVIEYYKDDENTSKLFEKIDIKKIQMPSQEYILKCNRKNRKNTYPITEEQIIKFDNELLSKKKKNIKEYNYSSCIIAMILYLEYEDVDLNTILDIKWKDFDSDNDKYYVEIKENKYEVEEKLYKVFMDVKLFFLNKYLKGLGKDEVKNLYEIEKCDKEILKDFNDRYASATRTGKKVDLHYIQFALQDILYMCGLPNNVRLKAFKRSYIFVKHKKVDEYIKFVNSLNIDEKSKAKLLNYNELLKKDISIKG